MDNQKIHKEKSKKCLRCNHIFDTTRGVNDREKRRYCSKQCQYAASNKKVHIKCKNCGKDTIVNRSREKSAMYCSRECKWDFARQSRAVSRKCYHCKQILDASKFYVLKHKTHIERVCIDCRRIQSKSRSRSRHGRYASSMHIAKRRSLEWNLSIEEYYDLLSSNKCHYCDDPLQETGTGLDRIDNNKGYILGNVIPCCSSCNITRFDNYSYEEMLVLSKTIKIIKQSRIHQDH